MDCMEGMKEFPDNYFDLAIVDPPYGINITGRHKCGALVGGGGRAFGGNGRLRQGQTAYRGGVTMKGPSRSSKCRLNFIGLSTTRSRRTKATLRNCAG